MIVAAGLIGYLVYKVFFMILDKDIENYNQFIEKLTKKNSFLKEIVKNIVNLFLLISFYVMIAAFSAYFSQELGIPNLMGGIILATICYIIFMGSIERITKVNEIFIPILILIIILLVILGQSQFSNFRTKQIFNSLPKGIYTAILYGSYNSITLIPIIIPLKKYITNKKNIIKVSIWCTIILLLLASCVWLIILKANTDINTIELPTVYVASQMGKWYQYSYGVVILVAIFTSAISAGYAILENKAQEKKKYKRRAFLLCASSIFVSKIGFSQLVNTLYPMFGILGMIEIALIIRYRK